MAIVSKFYLFAIYRSEKRYTNHEVLDNPINVIPSPKVALVLVVLSKKSNGTKVH